MRIYLDTCCYNRAVEESAQENMRAESEAVNFIINNRRKNGDIIIGSCVVYDEIMKISNTDRQTDVLDAYDGIDEEAPETDGIENRAAEFMKSANVKGMDSKHLAYAEAGKAEVFMTTDYRLIKAAEKLSLDFQVINPVDYPKWRRKQQ